MKYVKYACLLAALAIACASKSKSSRSEAPDDSNESEDFFQDDAEDEAEIDPNAGANLPPAEGPPAECLDEAGDSIQCDSDKDCCKGFYCGIDPEGSTRIKTCVYGGE